MTAQPAYDFFSNPPIATAIPAGASLFGSLADSQQNPVRFAPSSILAYIQSQLSSQVSSQNLVGPVPIALLPTRLQDIANIPPGSFTQGDLLYFGPSAFVRLPAGAPGQVLQTQGQNANPQWTNATVLNVGLSQNGQILYNSSGQIAGNAALTFNPVTGVLSASVVSVGAGPAVLTSPVAAALQLGAADAAAPTAQTLQAQSVLAGTSNTAGVNWTFIASKSTGNALGGNFVFQGSQPGGSGTSVNSAISVLTIAPSTAYATIFPAIYAPSLNLIVGQTGQIVIFGATSSGNSYGLVSSTEVRVLSGTTFGWSSSSLDAFANPADTFIRRNAAANLALGAADAAAPVLQTLGVQSVVAGTSNTAGVDFRIQGSASTGNAAGGAIVLRGTPGSGSSGTTQNAYVDLLRIDPTNNAANPLITAFSGTRFSVPYNNQPNVSQGFWFQYGGSASVGIGQTGNGLGSALGFGLFIGPGGIIAFSASAGGNATADTLLTRTGVATLQLGGADAAAPVAQTLSVQSVVAGTSNTAGALLTIKGSAGTGTGVGGDILFQATAAGSSGTAQNAFFNILRVSPTGGAGATLKVTDPNTGQFVLTSNSNNFGIGVGGQYQVSLLGNASQLGFALAADQLLGWSGANASGAVLGGMDTMIGRAAAATFRFGQVDAAAPVAQTLSVQNVVAGTSNTAGVNWTFKASAGTGTGAGGSFIFQGAPAGGSGTAQNSFLTALTIYAAGYTIAGPNTIANMQPGDIGVSRSGATSSGALFFGTDGSTAFYRNGNATFNIITTSTVVQLGNVDSAIPVAQTIQMQSVLAGTSNTAGVNWNLQASLSTGTGAAGNLLINSSFSGVTYNATSVTVTSASPGVVTLAAHGFVPGQPFQFGGTTAPGGTSFNTTYYVAAAGLTSSTFQFSAAPGGASINTSSTGTAVTLSTNANISSPQNPASTIATWGPSGLTGSQTTALLSLAQTWNTSGNAAAIVLNVKNIASGATSKFMDLQAGGTSLISFAPSTPYLAATGAIYAPGNLILGTLNQNIFFGATSSNQSHATLNNSTFTVQSGMTFGWSSGGDPGNVAADTTLSRLSVNCVKSAGAWASSAPNTQSGTTYTMVAGDSSLIFSNAATVTVTLLAASANTGRWLYVKNLGAGTLVSASSNVAPIGSATAGTAILAAGPGKWAMLQSDGSNWIILAAN